MSVAEPLGGIVSSPTQRRPLGVNVAGYLRSELGLGEVARQLIGALDAAGLPVVPLVLAADRSRQGHDYPAEPPPGLFDITIACVTAAAFPDFARDMGPDFFDGRYTIGFWWWELDMLPEAYRGAFELVDEVWAGSRFIAETLASISPVPVTQIPVPLDLVDPVPLRVGELGWPDAFTVLFSWDYNSVFARKNPLGAIEAFTRAFDPGDGAVLVLKCINHEFDAAHHAQVRAAARARPDIMLIDDYVSARDKNRLMASCDCYLSLHRSEGLGLTMAEAMGFAVPVVATGYSGNSDFLSERTGFPVAYELAPVGACAAPYPADARWAEPDVDDAARLLRLIFEDRAGAAEVAARGRDEIRRRYSPVAVGAVVEERLRAINALRPIHGTRGVPTDWRATARHAHRLRALRTQIAAGEQTTRAGAAE